jgi:hypothetical protein
LASFSAGFLFAALFLGGACFAFLVVVLRVMASSRLWSFDLACSPWFASPAPICACGHVALAALVHREEEFIKHKLKGARQIEI